MELEVNIKIVLGLLRAKQIVFFVFMVNLGHSWSFLVFQKSSIRTNLNVTQKTTFYGVYFFL